MTGSGSRKIGGAGSTTGRMTSTGCCATGIGAGPLGTGFDPPFAIKPRRGQFVVFDKPAAKLVNAIILPVPSEYTKGVVLFRTIFGNLAIGPTAEDVDEREVASCDGETLARLKARAIAMVPELQHVGINAIYAGLRPATQHKDYVIEALPERNWITIAGIRSTGLTASLGIAQHVARLYADHFARLPATPEPVWTPVPNLAELRPRPYQTGGDIVCHCELVTRAEIEAALTGPLPATDMGGLKRRTRAVMGRCQGFYCSAEVTAIMAEAARGTP
ncbi:MAG: FAD-dependent oxidoreductase [Rhizobiales bacterium]|nr:FAD-dependent oxidoreductase [Hyphomicrobiales bacterium]